MPYLELQVLKLINQLNQIVLSSEILKLMIFGQVPELRIDSPDN